jgi:hypothetical protein
MRLSHIPVAKGLKRSNFPSTPFHTESKVAHYRKFRWAMRMRVFIGTTCSLKS